MLNQIGRAMPTIGASAIPANAVASTNLIPLNGHVFIYPDKSPEKIGGLFIPPQEAGQNSGIVIAAASDVTKVKVGDRVVYSSFWPFEIDGKAHVCAMEKHLVGMLPAGCVLTTDTLAPGSTAAE